MALVGVQRSIALYRMASSEFSASADPTTALIGLGISLLLVVGIASLGAGFQRSERAKAKLRESERRLQSAAKMAKLGYFSWDLVQDRCLYCSEEYARIHGMSVEEYLATVKTLADDSAWVHPDDRARFVAAEQASLASLEPFELEYRILGKDGQVRHVREKEYFFEVEEGVATLTEGTLQDVSDVKEVEERLQQSQKMEAVGRLASGIAHDFNNLLAVIQGNAELLALDTESGDERIADILRAARRGADLTQRLLLFSRQQPLRAQTVDLSALTGDISMLVQRTLGETIEVEIECAPDLWPVSVDAGQLENALLNLAINARDAMPEGGRLRIDCENARLEGDHSAQSGGALGGDYVLISVSDTGLGMDDEVRRRAFEPFFTTKNLGKGNGLGLSTVFGFAAQSDGHVAIESEPGRGTCVRLYLPRAEKDQYPAAPPAADPPRSGGGERVLVVEDDVSVRALAVQMLEGLGYCVTQAADAETARQILRREALDLVLCDVVLPGGVGGPELAEAARKQAPNLQFVFMSGYAAEAVGGAAPPGPERLLRKPFRREELARLLDEALGH